jgi:hypothetical protein
VGSRNFFNIDSGGGYAGGFLDGYNPSDRVVTIDFDSPVSAFGFDKNSLNAGGFDVTIQFLSGSDQVFTNATPGSLSFFGWQSSATDITSVVVENNAGFFAFDFDNFTFGGSTNVVPEPTTLAIFGTICLIGCRRRRTS